jgi:hypothetical protein
VDFLRALAHAKQSPVPLPTTSLQHLRVNPFTVVADSRPQFMFTVRYLEFDLMGIRVPEGIDERLARNENGFLSDDRVQIARNPLYCRAKTRRLLDRELLA